MGSQSCSTPTAVRALMSTLPGLYGFPALRAGQCSGHFWKDCRDERRGIVDPAPKGWMDESPRFEQQPPEDMSEPSVAIIARRCLLCTHHAVKSGGKLARVLGCAPSTVKRTLERAVSGCQDLASYGRGWLRGYHPPLACTYIEREKNSRHTSRRRLLSRKNHILN